MSRRGKGEGTIFEQKRTRKDGSVYSRWCCEIITGYDKANDKIVKRVYGDSKPEVIAKKNELLADQQKGLLPETNSITIDKYFKHYIGLKNTNSVKIRTYESYKHLYELYIKDTLGKIPLQKLSTSKLNTFFSDLAKQKKQNDETKTLSANTIKRIKAVLSNMINTAISERILVVNVLKSTQKIKKQNSQSSIYVLSEDEIKLLVGKAKELYEKDNGKYLHIYHVVLLALASGMRRGELLALKWDNIDTENNKVTILENLVEVTGGVKFGEPKSRASKRTISISKSVMDELLKLKDNDKDKNKDTEENTTETTSDDEAKDTESKKTTDKQALVFHTASGKPVTPSNVSRSFRSLVKQCNLSQVRFHDMRHTHATTLLSKGVNIKQISARLGHESITITLQIYSHFMPAQDEESADIMGNMLV